MKNDSCELSKNEKLYIQKLQKYVAGAKMHLKQARKDVEENRDSELYYQSHHWYNRNLTEIRVVMARIEDKEFWILSGINCYECFYEAALEAAADFYGENVPEFPKRKLDV